MSETITAAVHTTKTLVRSQVTVTAAYTAAGDSVTYGAATSLVIIRNLQSPKWGIEYRVDSGSWIELGPRRGAELDIDLATQTLKVRRTVNAPASMVLDVEIYTAPAGLSADPSDTLAATVATTYAALTDKATVDLPAVNAPLAAALALKATGLNLDAVTSYFVGLNAGNASIGGNNVGVGYLALNAAGSGTTDCTAVGSRALRAQISGVGNTAVGRFALSTTTTGGNNTGIGDSALRSATGVSNTAVGYGAGDELTTGGDNVFVGAGAAVNKTSGQRNVIIGSQANYINTGAGSNNVAIGWIALRDYTGDSSTAVGDSALFAATGFYNTAFGASAGASITTGERNTFIGLSAGSHASQKVDAQYSVAIGYGAYTTANYQVVLGPSNITETLLRGKVGVNCTGPASQMQVAGDVSDYATTGIYAQLEIVGATSSGKRLALGYNTTANTGFIQAMRNGAAFDPLLLQASSGGVGINITGAPGARLHIAGSSTVYAALRIAPGVDPSGPGDGDMWYDGTSLKFRQGGTTRTVTLA